MLKRLSIPVLYDCANYLVANKPHGVLSQPSMLPRKNAAPGTTIPGEAVLLDELKCNFKDSASSEWRTVHRLDQVVTGGMLIAKNKNAAIQFSRNLKKGGNSGYRITRRYVAMVESGTEKSVLSQLEGEMTNGGMITRFRQIDDRCYVLELVTGKKHQIRKQLVYNLGKHILNDKKYGARPFFESNRGQIALHSAYIETKIGMQYRSHLIPIGAADRCALWHYPYITDDGYFNRHIEKMLVNGW